MEKFSGNIVDPILGRMFKGHVIVSNKRIQKIIEENNESNEFIFPGFVDSHIHIESSMLTPQNFSRIAVGHGTVATVSDPHEIANVMGEEGINYMLENSKQAEVKFFFGVPSCVPATGFESSGASLDSNEVRRLLQKPELGFLSEMMNYPGVINGDREVFSKLESARAMGKPIDGHAPGLRGGELEKYIKAGISTDHECYSIEEAREKIKLGMIIQIREGSAAKNFEALYPLLNEFPDRLMLCSDDLHPDDLLNGHMNSLFKKCLKRGVDFYTALRAVSVNPVRHYNLEVGLLQPGDPADFIILNNLEEMKVLKTFINGHKVYDINNGISNPITQKKINSFIINRPEIEDIKVEARTRKIKVIKVIDGELLTQKVEFVMNRKDGHYLPDIKNDVLKIVVQNRYQVEKPAVGYIQGFGLKSGGLVSSIAHDSHNIIAVGTKDEFIIDLVNWVNKNRGGVALHNGREIIGLELPVAGIISDQPAEYVAGIYKKLGIEAEKLGCQLKSPFMTLSFMALLVIPELKIGNKGLFDVNNFRSADIWIEE